MKCEVDRETVITHLQIIHTWASFARERDLQFFTAKHLEDIAQWAYDALDLLKEQKAVVLCKDCKFAEEKLCEIAYRFGEKDDWFCADGERSVK